MEVREKEQKAQSDETGDYAPRPLTFAENAMLTIKVLGGLGVIGALIWGINMWTAK